MYTNNNALTKKEWELLTLEVFTIQNRFWEFSKLLAKYDTNEIRNNFSEEEINEDMEKELKKIEKERFESYLMDGWERIIVVREALKKLGSPLEMDDIGSEAERVREKRTEKYREHGEQAMGAQ